MNKNYFVHFVGRCVYVYMFPCHNIIEIHIIPFRFGCRFRFLLVYLRLRLIRMPNKRCFIAHMKWIRFGANIFIE